MGVTEIVYATSPRMDMVGTQFPRLGDAIGAINAAFGLSNEPQDAFERAYVVPADDRFDWALLGTAEGHHLVRGVRTAARFSPHLATVGVCVRRDPDGSGRWLHWRDLTPLVSPELTAAEANRQIARQISEVCDYKRPAACVTDYKRPALGGNSCVCLAHQRAGTIPRHRPATASRRVRYRTVSRR
eukprot:3170728-Prymnesium_polylepis.3